MIILIKLAKKPQKLTTFNPLIFFFFFSFGQKSGGKREEKEIFVSNKISTTPFKMWDIGIREALVLWRENIYWVRRTE